MQLLKANADFGCTVDIVRAKDVDLKSVAPSIPIVWLFSKRVGFGLATIYTDISEKRENFVI